MSTADLRLGRCGCCAPPAAATPERVANRPALDAVGYRVGTYASFRHSMIHLAPRLAAGLAAEAGLPEPPLLRWTSRDGDDYGVALFELWATVGDILTFYQERYANEAWLRTARRRASVRRLAGLLGYRLGPGVAAGTHLALSVDGRAPVGLPAGLRVQSVPAAGEVPVTFETGAALTARSELNRARLYPAPVPGHQLAAGRRSGTLAAGSTVPVPGDELLVFTPGVAGVERRRVEAVEEVAGRSVVHWSRPLDAARARAFVAGRSFRLFGHSAPPTWLEATPAGTTPAQFLAWEQRTTPFASIAAAADLEGAVEGLEVGAPVLVVAGGVAQLRTITGVAAQTGAVGPLAGPVTRVSFAGPPTLVDVRTATVHELLGELLFEGWEVPAGPIPAGAVTVHVRSSDVPAVEGGRLLVLGDDRAEPFLAAAEAPAAPAAVAGEAGFLAVPLAGPTPRELDGTNAHLLGNVVAATHGETVTGEVLGDGDAAQALQAFVLQKGPLTHVVDPAGPGGVRPALDVRVDGVRWSTRTGLYGAGPADRVYTVEIDDDHRARVRFGDGRSGARLPAGRGNVVATYRHGIGQAGNLGAGRITTALQRPTGLREVVNPVPASGGVDPEPLDQARGNAPGTVRTFDRAVSLRDFADLARQFAGVAKAAATWVWDGEERVVHLTVGGAGGASLADRLDDLRAYLDLRRDPNRGLRVAEFRPLPFRVQLTVEVEEDRATADVRAAAAAAVAGYFAYERRAFGQAVHLSDVYAAVHEAPGVVSARVGVLRYKRLGDALAHGVGLAPVVVHAPVFVARPGPGGPGGGVLPAELAVLESPADAVVAAVGGLPS